ncbi:transcription initiation factor TFIID subunit 9-like isoform 2 [Cricetulus griseus]|nr:transcription initiation factor TFIID subunit 9-like isoform 2 [Cricetulus griseus]
MLKTELSVTQDEMQCIYAMSEALDARLSEDRDELKNICSQLETQIGNVTQKLDAKVQDTEDRVEKLENAINQLLKQPGTNLFTVQMPASQSPAVKASIPETSAIQNVLINPSLIGSKDILITTNMVSQNTANESTNALKRKREDDYDDDDDDDDDDEDDYDNLQSSLDACNMYTWS